MSDCMIWSAVRFARAIQARETSCMSVIREHLERIETVNPKLDAAVGFALNGPERRPCRGS
jgi:Asp-tRNA(Asn)/Glu-tRNA(Gln) amidotransferase A subunit family amidase